MGARLTRHSASANDAYCRGLKPRIAMTDRGMREVANPSAIFLQRGELDAPGSVATVTWEGTRPLLVELQALVDEVAAGYPKRVAVGLDQQRLAMLRLGEALTHLGRYDEARELFDDLLGQVFRFVEYAAFLQVLEGLERELQFLNQLSFGQL